ncbi:MULTISPECIES: YopX family protein [Bacillus cereus group]|uniref:YopX family protein n=1 Tax=Bacillus cereus group TaxID=86661 RepID=UPI0018CDD659|nr:MULTISPECIES: YopX family protein [Bacillus cereus group]MBG9837932.1 hypothetical protein [Bacillus tropicus]MBG9880163.1 hypothetical protein [Bacillus tropicus]MBG9923411.1 hypothetical protein [Bacillus tropicus]MBJ8355315.1 hypothetical protein [Bacillus mycoides]MED2903898.1 YopX family protein [Bacillus tropicus]
MRKIEFRVWDGTLMHNVSELHFCMGPKLDGNGLKFYGPGVGQGWIDGENVHLMQYTGLKDKNGKEIYEGDIIRNDRGTILKVPFVDGAFYAEGTDALSKQYVFSVLSDFSSWSEVVGNIYENPELLEESK